VTTRLQTLALAGPAGALEAVLHEREGNVHDLVALVCHPHPLYRGTMHNKVTHRVASTLHDLGAAVLRFNFRGAGKSEGRFDRGEGELEDARAAFAWLTERHPQARRWVAGFSFGSWVGTRLAASQPSVEQLVVVAPPVQRSSFEALRSSAVPKLVFQGTADDICPLEALQKEYPRWAEPKRLFLIPEASHFFDRQLGALAQAIAASLALPARGAA